MTPMRHKAPLMLAVLPAGLVYTVLPHGLFGAYDIAMRSVMCGAATGVTAWLLIESNTRPDRTSL